MVVIMSKMSEIFIEIREMYEAGYDNYSIAKGLNVPISWVLDIVDQLEYIDPIEWDEAFAGLEDVS